ncbi:MAG: serine/threonine protein kinase [Myxococcales bacterium]|nr:serine/threonine protein kinase [Myxococcales bacterium]
MATVEQSITALENLLGPHLFSLELGLGSPLILANRYWIKDIRGRGARGLVVRARDTNLERDVAIKLYPHRDAATISEAEAEAKVLAKLRHDNIVLVFDSDFADLFIDNVRVPCLFIVMEYIEGPHLRAWIANENPGPLAILDAFIEAGQGLAAAHAKGIYHRDVKPANIVIDRRTARVVDFGLARQVLETDGGDARATQYGVAIGTLAYMAPEARRGISDERSDLFAFAVSLWESLSGKLPFDPEAGEWRLGNHEDFFGAERIPKPLAEPLKRAMSYEPAQRHASMEELLAELRARRDQMQPSLFSGLVDAIRKSPLADRVREVVERPASELASSWAEQARLIQERAAAEAEREERRRWSGGSGGDT